MRRRNPEAWGHVRDARTRNMLQGYLEQAQLAHIRFLEATMWDPREARTWAHRLEAAEEVLDRFESQYGPAWKTRSANPPTPYRSYISQAKRDLLAARTSSGPGAYEAARRALYFAEKAYRLSLDGGDPMRTATADQLRWEATRTLAEARARNRNPTLLRALLRA